MLRKMQCPMGNCPYLAFGLKKLSFYGLVHEGVGGGKEIVGEGERVDVGGVGSGGRGGGRGDGGQAFREVFASSDLSSQA